MKIVRCLMVAVFFFLVGCGGGSGSLGGKSGSKLTAENFLRIKSGMNHQEVTLILGQPTKKEGSTDIGARVWTWQEGSKEITVIIDNNGNVMDNGGSALKTQKGLE